MPNLEKLQQDEDVDVRYFSTVAAGGTTNVYARREMDTDSSASVGRFRMSLARMVEVTGNAFGADSWHAKDGFGKKERKEESCGH